MDASSLPAVAFPNLPDASAASVAAVRPETDGPGRSREEEPRSSLHVVAADGDPAARCFYQEALPRLGHEVCVARTGPELVEQCRLLRPDLVLAALRLPGMDGITAADEICRERPTPVVLVADSYEPLWVARALGNDCILACLARPTGAAALGAALAVAVRRFERMESWRAEAAAARQALEDRKLVERAKGAIVRYTGLDEEEAYRRLRRVASDGNRRLPEAARDVLASAEVFRALEQADGAGRRDGENGHPAQAAPGTHPLAAPRRRTGHRG